MTDSDHYAARLDIDYQERSDRLSTLLRIIWIIPIAVILALLTNSGDTIYLDQAGHEVRRVGHAGHGLFLATVLMILFRQKYPRWWFDFVRELTRFAYRVGAYLFLLTDKYPSTDEEQSIHLEIDYPNVTQDLNPWLPLIKWLLAIPHYIVLFVLGVVSIFVVIVAWFSIVFTGSYPKPLFDFVVGVGRWHLRVIAYAFLLVTDKYPPFSMD